MKPSLDWMNNAGHLSEVELMWLLCWNVAAGSWDRIGVPPAQALEWFAGFAARVKGNPADLVENSRIQLARSLLQSSQPSPEKLKGEPPFDLQVQQNLTRLLTAARQGEQSKLAAEWDNVFLHTSAARPKLSDIDLAWLSVWNVGAGNWDKLGLNEHEAQSLLIHFVSCLQVAPLKALDESRGALMQRLMAIRRDTFEEIQREPPFCLTAYRNLQSLLAATQNTANASLSHVWNQIFHKPHQHELKLARPISVTGGDGNSEQNAFGVQCAPDDENRVAAEWWWLYYSFGRNWSPVIHQTLTSRNGDAHFSLHEISLPSGTLASVYFRLPW